MGFPAYEKALAPFFQSGVCDLFRAHDGFWFKFETTLTDYKYEACLKECLDERPEISPTVYGANRDQFKAPPSDLNTTKLALLTEMRAGDNNTYGSKAANLGEVIHSHPKAFDVPPGFGIPFVYYKKFMESNGLFDIIDELMDDQDFVHNPSVRKKKLEAFRQAAVSRCYVGCCT